MEKKSRRRIYSIEENSQEPYDFSCGKSRTHIWKEMIKKCRRIKTAI